MKPFVRSFHMACLKRRGKIYYAQYYVGRKQKRVSLETSSLQIAKEKIRQMESRLVRGDSNPLPTKTPPCGGAG